MTATFQDHFSGHADDYARYRPAYPAALFDWLADVVPARDRAWDCASGSGQAALGLAERFLAVDATDGSAEQLAQMPAHPRVHRRVATAERSGLPARSVDLVTVAQALHWFDVPAFHAECARVVRPGGIVAAWCYGALTVDPAVDAVVAERFERLVGGDWPAERPIVMRGYVDLPWPWGDAPAPPFTMEARWTLDDLLGYFGTWSATKRYVARTGDDPFAATREAFEAAWGDPARPRAVRWPLAVRWGRVG
jgi:SAM-dependent methyltransferase